MSALDEVIRLCYEHLNSEKHILTILDAKSELFAIQEEIERLKAENNNIYNSHERILKADDVIRAAEFAQLNNLYIKTFRMLEECEENLVGMVEQYCRYNSDANRFGHDFMSAGESTFEYLVKHGLAEYTENGVDIKLIPQPPEEK